MFFVSKGNSFLLLFYSHVRMWVPGMGLGAYASLQTTVKLMKRLNKIKVEKIIFGNKEYTTDKKNENLRFIETLHKQ